MAARKSKKKIITLESFFENILVCNDRNLRPFIETFYYEPENVTQEKLGTLFGIIEISDDSEESSYIVNYLISVIRKEYFSKPKRGAVESLEAALHKANLALSKLAEHGSLSWLGKLNAIVSVIEKNNLHLSQTGNNSALLFRNKTLTDIGEDPDEINIEPHPLKTFVDVTSGRLENDDKLILTSEVIFEIFSLEEIKKSAIRFSIEEFNQFIRTAFSNEVSKAAMLIVNLKEKEEIIEVQPTPKIGSINAFSQTAFSQTNRMPEPEATITEETQESVQKQPNGHLYIKESEVSSSIKTPDSSNVFSTFREKVSVFIPKQKNNQLDVKSEDSSGEKINLKKVATISFLFSKKAFLFIWKKLKILFIFLWKVTQIAYYKSKSTYENIRQKRNSQKELSEIREEQELKINIFKKIIPRISFLRSLLSRYTRRQKIIIIVIILIFFIIIPIFINTTWKSFRDKADIVETQPIVLEETPPPLVDDKNLIRLERMDTLIENINLNNIIKLNESFFAVSKNEIINLQNQESYQVPEDLGEVNLSIPMEDLNIILLSNNDNSKIISFSPANNKFQTNTFSLPENSSIIAGDTYLTYLYLLDQGSNQIYRYPRAEGGFGEKNNWKKDTTNIKDATEIAINENIFLINQKNILKFFRGNKIDFSFEASSTPIIPSKLWTEEDNPNLYVLDTVNSRIIKLDSEGKIINQFYHSEISQAQEFSIDEKQEKALFSTDNQIKSFSINNQ